MRKTHEKLVVKSALKVLKLDQVELNVDPSYQRDVKAKHKKIVAEYNEEAFGIPLIGEREDGGLWIVDGLQRITAKRKLGHRELRAEVFNSKGPEHEAEVFKLVNLNRTKLSAWEEFKALLTAGDELAWSVKNVVEKCGFRVVQGYTTNAPMEQQARYITGVATMMQLTKHHGPEPLEFTLRTVKEAWPGDKLAVNNRIIYGMTNFFVVRERVVDEERLVERMRKTTPAKVLYTAAQMVNIGSGGGGSQVTAIIEKLYTKRMKKS